MLNWFLVPIAGWLGVSIPVLLLIILIVIVLIKL